MIYSWLIFFGSNEPLRGLIDIFVYVGGEGELRVESMRISGSVRLGPFKVSAGDRVVACRRKYYISPPGYLLLSNYL